MYGETYCPPCTNLLQAVKDAGVSAALEAEAAKLSGAAATAVLAVANQYKTLDSIAAATEPK